MPSAASDGLDASYKPSRELSEFLQAGSAPIFIGFGSIVVGDPARLSKIVVDTVAALAKTHRFVVQAGWADLDISSVPEAVRARVIQLGPVPHRWLFNRCKLVVHHGGAGTTAEALRAGKPSVIVPFFGDQFFWARTVKETRVGQAVTQLSTKNLCVAIEAALGSGTRMRAQVLGKAIAREKGGDIGVAFIERQFLAMPKLVDGVQPSPQQQLAQQQRRPVEPRADYTAWANAAGLDPRDVAASERWRAWPYVDMDDKAHSAPTLALGAIGKRVKVVGKVLKHTIASQGAEPEASVELKDLHVTDGHGQPATPRRAAELGAGLSPRKSLERIVPQPQQPQQPQQPPPQPPQQQKSVPPPCGHTRFSFGPATAPPLRRPPGHTAFTWGGPLP